MTPRGIRNNNPGNIRISPTKWQGKEDPSSDPAFEVFSDPVDGLRAIAVILHTYFHKKPPLNTVAKIINRWAPPLENDTDAYIDNVSSAMGVKPNDILDLECPITLAALVEAIVTQENGEQPYSANTVDLAVQRALTPLTS